jgi:hypothetical protein
MSDYKIYPPIGIARVGDAPDKFYIGPEIYRGLPTTAAGKPITSEELRDDGRLCRQAALFHIFRTTENGVEEVTLDTPNVLSITWQAHLANKKPSWYTFVTNEGQNGYASNHPLRNPGIKDRNQLMIDAGPRKTSGRNASPVRFDETSMQQLGYNGHFPQGNLLPGNEPINYLGELRTDQFGRLLVLGGYGISGTTDLASIDIEMGYANNDNWWDDTADGPVFAVVEINTTSGIEKITVEASWVVVAPPAYAPEIPNLVTLWDTIFDRAVNGGHFPAIKQDGAWQTDYKPSFKTEIGPLLERATLYTWVTAIPPKPHRFDMTRMGAVPDNIADDINKGLRHWILDVLRAPSQENEIISERGATMMPYLAGDNCLNPETLTSKYLRLTDTQYFFLNQWATGKFVADGKTSNPAESITRGVLENCVGGAFSPGIEMGWISRNSAIYHPDDPFRINAKLVEQGPLSSTFHPQAMEPGDISRYMAIPWQADFNECSSQPLDGRTIWWWPSQRPEFVYLKASPKNTDNTATPDINTGAQVAWLGTDFDQLRPDFISFAHNIEMVKYWSGLGFVLGQTENGETRYFEVSRTLPRPFIPGD